MNRTVRLLKEYIEGTIFEGKVFVAGGAVRDFLMGKESKDIDLLVDLPDGGLKFARHMSNTLKSKYVEFQRYGVGVFAIEGVDVECVMPRIERYDKNSRHPEVKYCTVIEDVKRRDFTINSLLWDITNEKVIDLTKQGVIDLKHKIIRTVGHSTERFKEDPLRILRSIRFFSKLSEFDLCPDTRKGIQDTVSMLRYISSERIREELYQILIGNRVKQAFKLMEDLGILKVILPEFHKLASMTQNKHHHETVLYHSLSVVEKCEKDSITRLCALFHDIGKLVTRTEEDGKVKFLQHHKEGAPLAEQILRRLKVDNNTIKIVTLVIKNHMKLKQAGPKGTLISDKALRKFILSCEEELDRVLSVIDADNKSHAPDSNLPIQISSIRERIDSLELSIKNKDIELPIDGVDLMVFCGLKPGPEIGRLLGIVREEVLQNPNLTKEQAFAILKEHLT